MCPFLHWKISPKHFPHRDEMQIHLVDNFRWWKDGLFMWQIEVFSFKLCSNNILLSFVGHRLIITWHFSHQPFIASHGSSLLLMTQSFFASPIQMFGMHFPDEVQLALPGMHPHLWPWVAQHTNSSYPPVMSTFPSFTFDLSMHSLFLQ